jgi:hypothetical protein
VNGVSKTVADVPENSRGCTGEEVVTGLKKITVGDTPH